MKVAFTSLMDEAVKFYTTRNEDYTEALSMAAAIREGPADLGDIGPRDGEGPGWPTEVLPLINVPADGMCLYHCVVAAHDVPRWLREHDDRGIGTSLEMQVRDTQRAKEAKAAIVNHLRLLGHVDITEFFVSEVSRFLCIIDPVQPL